MDFDDLVAEVLPPEKRAGKAEGGMEHRQYEGAVMVAYPSSQVPEIRPSPTSARIIPTAGLNLRSGRPLSV